MQTLRVNNSRLPTTKIAKVSGYYFYMNLNIQEDFQICISVPLMTVLKNSFVIIYHVQMSNSKKQLPRGVL